MKHLILLLALFSGTAHAQTTADEIAITRAKLESLQKQQAAENAPAMYAAMATMTTAAANCVSNGIAAKGTFTRTATVSKACREQAMLGAFSICAITVAQTGDTRDLNQCTAMMKDSGQWQQVWMRGLGIAGMIAGVDQVGSILTDVVTPITLAAIAKEPAAPIIVDPLVVEPTVVEPTVIEVEPFVIETAPTQ